MAAVSRGTPRAFIVYTEVDQPAGTERIPCMILNPSKLALCIMIAGDNHSSGVLLYRITFWMKNVSARIPKMPGVWIANNHEFWKTDTRLSRDQLTRSLKYLKGEGLIEREQFWWAGRNILHVRPTSKTVEFLDAATTWPAAEELFAEAKNHTTEISKCAGPCSAILLNSNGSSKSAHPASADLPSRAGTRLSNGFTTTALK